MASRVECPICLSYDGYSCTAERFGSRDATLFRCDVCGVFAIAGSALTDQCQLRVPPPNKAKRAALSHQLRINQDAIDDVFILTTDDFHAKNIERLRLASPIQQATNAIRFIGDIVSDTGDCVEDVPTYFSAAIGAPSRSAAFDLLVELKNGGLISGYFQRHLSGFDMSDLNLTLRGWTEYEREKKGKINGNYGFIALKFNDHVLDPFLQNHIKPAVSTLGFQLFDLRDVSRAGIIDNILRVQIRDSSFVLVDLTHENAGAYWEAGYAEGLGKPVLYLCEKRKFEQNKTHFDTNHCTTVLWDKANPDLFREELISTLRRSLI